MKLYLAKQFVSRYKQFNIFYIFFPQWTGCMNVLTVGTQNIGSVSIPGREAALPTCSYKYQHLSSVSVILGH